MLDTAIIFETILLIDSLSKCKISASEDSASNQQPLVEQDRSS